MVKRKTIKNKSRKNNKSLKKIYKKMNKKEKKKLLKTLRRINTNSIKRKKRNNKKSRRNKKIKVMKGGGPLPFSELTTAHQSAGHAASSLTYSIIGDNPVGSEANYEQPVDPSPGNNPNIDSNGTGHVIGPNLDTILNEYKSP